MPDLQLQLETQDKKQTFLARFTLWVIILAYIPSLIQALVSIAAGRYGVDVIATVIAIPILEAVQIFCLVMVYRKRTQRVPYLLIAANVIVNTVAYSIKGGDTVTLGAVVILALSVLSANLMSPQKAIRGILAVFIGGTILASSNYIFHPGSGGLNFGSVDFVVSALVILIFLGILISQFKKYAINVKLVLMISLIVLVSSMVIGAFVMLNISFFSGLDPMVLVRLKSGLVVGSAIVISLSAIVSVFIARTFTAPMEKLVKVADATVHDGDIQQKIEVESRDEIGQLAVAFSSMQTYFREMAGVAQKLANYDLTGKVDPRSEKDLFGHSFQKIIESLNEIVLHIYRASDQMNNGAAQVSAASQALSQGASEQAGALQEISSSVTELASQSKTNTENALQVNQISLEARASADQGNIRMKELVTAMGEVSQSADGIRKVVKNIDDIAFQINLLALNANIEAARAGKYGKGFAVVAQEVRNLAVRTANLVQETSVLVDTTVSSIRNGDHLLKITAEQFNQILSGSARVVEIAQEVSRSSREQSTALQQINSGLGQISQVTQANTANAEETAAASEELSSQASYLKKLISRFRI